jgi:aromatic-amino-acid transaminase
MKNDVILVINQKAQERKKQGVDVTNGSIGMMFLDDGTLPVGGPIRALLGRHTTDQDLCYSSVAGTKEYQEAVRHWFLGSSFDEEAKNGNYKSLATPGGTGAVTLSFSDSRKGKSILLFPSLDWPNYEGIAAGFKTPYESYELFEDGHFGLGKLKKQIVRLLGEYEKITVVVNDPCENPTGYSLEAKEWEALVALLSEKGILGKVDLIIDAAYIDYAKPESRAAMIKAVKSIPSEILVYFCFSFSKTLSFYGLRIGALALYSHDAAKVNAAYDASVMEARALWSVPNHMAMNAVTELVDTPATYKSLKDEVQKNREIVAKRASIFLKEADECGIKYFPYRDGFFITLDVPDAFALGEKLMAKDIFLAPVKEKALRIALCALPTKKVPGLAKSIAEALKE